MYGFASMFFDQSEFFADLSQDSLSIVHQVVSASRSFTFELSNLCSTAGTRITNEFFNLRP